MLTNELGDRGWTATEVSFGSDVCGSSTEGEATDACEVTASEGASDAGLLDTEGAGMGGREEVEELEDGICGDRRG